VTQQRTVEVWGERYDLIVSQDANGLWVATGTYKRQKIEVKDKTEAAALKRWEAAGRAKGP
jgi:hypothetical protein